MSILKGIPFLRQELTKIFMKRAADKSGIMQIPFKNKKLQLDIEDRVQKYIRDAEKQGVDLNMISNQNLKYTIKLNENTDPISRIISADSEQGRRITNMLLGKRGEVVDMTGKKLDTSQGIMGGKSVTELMESGQVSKGTEGLKKSKKVQDREMFENSNLNKTEAQIKAEIEASNKKSVKKIKDNKDNRQMTDEEYEEFIENIGGEERLEAYDFDGTVGSGKKILKEDRDYFNEMELEYKKGNLDPKPGEKNRKEFLQKKLNDAELSGDKRLITKEEIDELIDLENTPIDPEDMADGGVAGLLGERPGYVNGGSTNPFMPMQNRTPRPLPGFAPFDPRPFQKAPQTDYSKMMDKQSVYTPFFSGRIKDEFDEKTQTAFDEGAKISRNIPFDFIKDEFDKQGYPSDIRHGLGTSAFKDAVTDYITSNLGVNADTNLFKGITPENFGSFAANAGSLFTEVPDMFSQAKAVAESKGPYGNIDDYLDEPDTRFLTQPIEDIKANYVGSKIPFSLRNNLKGKKYFIDNFNKYGSNTMNQLKLNQERAMQDQIKKAAAKAAAEKSQQQIRQAQTTASAQRNKDSNRGGYQSSFSQDKGFMEGSGTAAEMGSFAEGGPARQNFKMGKRAFLKLMAGAGAGIAGLKSGLFGLGKGVTKKAVTETVKQTAGTPPPYFLNLVAKIKKLGDDITEKAAVADRQKVHQYKDYELTEDVTGKIEIQKKSLTGEMYPGTEEVYMSYTPGETIIGKNKKSIKTKPEYTEDTSKISKDGRLDDVEPGVPDEVVQEGTIFEDTLSEFGKADGGRIGYAVGKKVIGKGIMTGINKLFGKPVITTADKIKRPQKALDREMFKRFETKYPKLSEVDEDLLIRGKELDLDPEMMKTTYKSFIEDKGGIGSLKEFHADFVKQTGKNIPIDNLRQAWRLKRAYPFNTPVVDKTGKYIGGEATQKMYPESKKFLVEESAESFMKPKVKKTTEREFIDVPPMPKGFKLSREKLEKNYPELDEDMIDQIMELDKEMQGTVLTMLKNRRKNPDAYDKLLETKGDTLEFQGAFDEVTRKSNNADGGRIGLSTGGRIGYSAGGGLFNVLKLLLKRKPKLSYLEKYPRVNIKELMKGDKPIKLFSGVGDRQANTLKAYKEDAKFFNTTVDKIKKDNFKGQWFTPFKEYASSFGNPSNIKSKMLSTELTPKEIRMAKRYVEKINKKDKMISKMKMEGMDNPPKYRITTDDNTVIIPKIKLKKLKKAGKIDTDYMVLEKIKSKLGLSKGGLANMLGE